VSTFVYRTRIPAPAGYVFNWLERPGALERLTPPWERVRIMKKSGGLENGSRVTLRHRVGPYWQEWLIEHRDFIAGRQFRDIQILGPFNRWEHLHLVEPDGENACFLEDRIEYRMPLLGLSQPVMGFWVRKRLQRMFAYRHAAAASDIAAHYACRDRGSLRILISASTGLLGSNLVPFLTAGGHRVVRLVRKPLHSAEEEIVWNPAVGELDPAQLEGFDAIIHLSGENIAPGRWKLGKRERVWNSRVRSTELLVNAVTRLKQPPKVFVCASGTGWYGEGGDTELTEDTPSGSGGFFVDLVRTWEAAAEPAARKGIRVVNARIGVVLTPAGGALKMMLPAFLWGAGSVLADANHYTAWLTLDDILGMFHHVVMTDSLRGPVNFVTQPITQKDFSIAVGRVLNRPVWLTVPVWAIRLMIGQEMAEAMSWNQRVIPAKLAASRYRFRYPDLDAGLRHVLGETDSL